MPQQIQTRHGLMNIHHPNDYISQHLIKHGEYEWYVVDIIRQLCLKQAPGTILDVGANVGCICLPVAKMFPDHDVLAFEIQPEVLGILKENITANQLTNISVYDFALGAEPGAVTLPAPDYDTATNVGAFTINPMVQKHSDISRGTGSEITVQVQRLDDVEIDRPIRCIKLDVEGFEMQVLKGAERTLEQHGFPPVVYELWSYHRWWDDHAREIQDWLTGRGYRITRVDDTAIAVQNQ